MGAGCTRCTPTSPASSSPSVIVFGAARGSAWSAPPGPRPARGGLPGRPLQPPPGAAPPRLEERAPPAASVILPTYERRELVREAVASILAQTFADFELIVVDDGSTDGTGEALHGLDPRLVYVWQ